MTQLEPPVEAAHGWSGRDLMAHMLAWQGIALEVARELAVNETSPTIARVDADWETRGGDVVNDEIQADLGGTARSTSCASASRTQPGELRGLPDGRPRDALDQARRPPEDASTTRRSPTTRSTCRPGRDPGGRGPVTLRELLADARPDERRRGLDRSARGRLRRSSGWPRWSSPSSMRRRRVAAFRLDRGGRRGGAPDARHGASHRGPDWVRFRPATLDDHAADRAVAWFGFAAGAAIASRGL